MEKFNTDFDYFWNLIDQNQNFTFARYADGEVMLMKGISVSKATQAFQVDKWQAPDHLTKVGQDLLATLNHNEDNYFYAISAKNDNIADYNYLRQHITQKPENLTFVNLWINANYTKMKNKLNHLKRDVILICNHRADKKNFPFNVIDITPFPDDCVNFWENNGDSFIKELVAKYQSYNDTLFLISCGPVSEIIIHHLYLANPNNSYIDVGSAIDEFVHQRITRPYANSNSIYHNMVSSFEDVKLNQISIPKKWLRSCNKKIGIIASKIKNLLKKNSYYNQRCFKKIIANLDSGVPKLIYLHHEWGGGTHMYLENKIEQLKGQNYIFVIFYQEKLAKFNLQIIFKDQFASVLFSDFKEISDLFNKINIDRIYINQISFFPDLDIIFNFIKQTRNNAAKTTMLVHDFSCICVKTHLIKDDGQKCDMLSNRAGCSCSQLAAENVKKWESFLTSQTDEILCFSNNSKQIISQFYPAISGKINVAPHYVPFLRKAKIIKTNKIINIAIIGFLNKIKGCNLVEEMSHLIINNNLPVRILVIGKAKIKNNKALKIYGKYRRKDLPKIVEKNQIDIVFISSICEETFSYAAHEAMAMEIKVACFAIGAQLEYIAKYDQGLIISKIDAKTALDEILNFVKPTIK